MANRATCRADRRPRGVSGTPDGLRQQCAAPDLVSVSNGGCGTSWRLAAPGWHAFQIYNAAAESAGADLVDPANGAIYAEVNGLGPGTGSPMRLDVGSGSYAFRCLFDDYDPITEPTAVVGGHVTGRPRSFPSPATTCSPWPANTTPTAPRA